MKYDGPYPGLSAAFQRGSGIEVRTWISSSHCAQSWGVFRDDEAVGTYSVAQFTMEASHGQVIFQVTDWIERLVQHVYAPIIEASADYLWFA